MNPVYASVCLGLITLGLWIALAFSLAALFQLRRTLRAIEALSYHLMESAENLHKASVRMQDFANHVRSGWMRAFELGIGAIQSFWRRRPDGGMEEENDSCSEERPQHSRGPGNS